MTMFALSPKKVFMSSALVMMLLPLGYSATITSSVQSANGTTLGQVTFEDSKYGLLIKPKLAGLPPAGIHGFHIHEKPDCGDKGMKAGKHFDPTDTDSHQGPYGKGHLGDLPILVTNAQGEATIPTLAPRLRTQDIHKRAIMIHAGGDNYSDNPPLGGGGERIGCGIIP